MAAPGQRLVISPDGAVAALGERRDLPEGIVGLVAQEVGGHRRGPVNGRVDDLADLFGFGFEPWAEPGHLRMLPMAAWMHASAEAHARQRVRMVADRLQLPFDEVSGVLVVDTSNPALAGYLDLIHADANLYGAETYALSGTRENLILRQTSCLEKFSVAAGWDWDATRLPRCLFEISDSFRGEPDEAVEQLFRLRRFRLPEAHLYSVDLDAAMSGARDVNAELAHGMLETAQEFVLLVSVSAPTWAAYRQAIATMVAECGSWALVLVSAQGELCQDGIELDFEYKFLDATGFPRELATFQVDTAITAAVGLAGRGGGLATTHLVPSGSVERLLYAHLDRVARLEGHGVRAHLPSWLTPVQVRLLEDPTGLGPGLDQLAALADQHGLRCELDDRQLPPDAKVADADAHLVPVTVSVDPHGSPDQVLVRDYTDQRLVAWRSEEWLASMTARAPRTTAPMGSSPRLSTRPTQSTDCQAPLH